jgi:two-component system response regulator YesN
MEEKENFPSALSEILRYINEHYREPLTRRSVAQAVGYNESYLSHLFSEYLDQSFSDYLLHLRLSEAADLLRSSSENISTIALSLGFGSIRSFNRAFSKAMKVSPRTYRKNTD